ncbi:uncharacterized protein LOC128962561 [Oppia nitens]|uniref:uncharacterized protein LOC128962561 n=1 Tax=Oppia nitens TaxID=1686743 RepID=UPI0023DBDB4D|nr:uncharacterized protein LOC128962561 [Oppia nitens]
MLLSLSSLSANQDNRQQQQHYHRLYRRLSLFEINCKQTGDDMTKCFRHRWRIRDILPSIDDTYFNQQQQRWCCYLLEIKCAANNWLTLCTNTTRGSKELESLLKNCTDNGFAPNVDNCLPLMPNMTIDGVCNGYGHCFDYRFAVDSYGLRSRSPALYHPLITSFIIAGAVITVFFCDVV